MSDTKINKTSLMRKVSPVDRGVLNRLVDDQSGATSNGSKPRLDMSQMSQIFRSSSRDVTDIRNIFKVMPWLHLPREILVSSIVSPGDLIQVKLTFGSDLKAIPKAITSQLDKVLADFFINEQGLESKVYSWVDDAMIAYGSHPILIIPEASLDKMINSMDSAASLEAISKYDNEWVGNWFKPKGILAVNLETSNKSAYVSMESVGRHAEIDLLEAHTIKGSVKTDKGTERLKLPITVTDNLIALRKVAVKEAVAKRNKRNIYGNPAFEAVSRKTNFNDEQIKDAFFRRPKRATIDRVQVTPSTTADENVEMGHPLTFHLPHESVVPVFIPGDVTNHAWYIVIIDQNGYPVSYDRSIDFYQDVASTLMTSETNEASDSSDILRMAKNALVGEKRNVNSVLLDDVMRSHSTIIEADLVNRIRNGLTGGEFNVSMPDQVKRMMFSRTLKNQSTTLVLVPADYMVYLAYEYNEFGIGKSILDDAKALAAQTAAVHVAQVIGAVQNTIPGKDINITLDPEDETPVETVTTMASDALALAYRTFPTSIGTVQGLTDQLQLSAFSINVEGNPNYPEVKSTITARESTKVEIDTDYLNSLKDGLNKVFGLTSEMVDGVNQPEFATTAVNNSLSLLKRVMVGQSKTNPHLTDYVRIYSYNSGILLSRLVDALKSNETSLPQDVKENSNLLDLVEEYLNTVTCSLSKPQTDNFKNQSELLESLDTTITAFVKAFVSPELFASSKNKDVTENMDEITAMITAFLKREYIRKHGLFTELDVFGADDDGLPISNVAADTEALQKSIIQMLGKLPSKLTKMKNPPEDTAASGGNDYDPTNEFGLGDELPPDHDDGEGGDDVPADDAGAEDNELGDDAAFLDDVPEDHETDGDTDTEPTEADDLDDNAKFLDDVPEAHVDEGEVPEPATAKEEKPDADDALGDDAGFLLDTPPGHKNPGDNDLINRK